MKPQDKRHMALAISLGRRGLGRCWPNPSVGCVIVSGGRIVGRGRTADGGAPHAETEALKQAGSLANGAAAYVTLEPCAHQGRTPPCANALVGAGIARVVISAGDPNPQVNGQGIAILRDAGIEVSTGVLQSEAEALHEGFFKRINLGRPYVTLKLANSFDGRIATANGESQWITGPEARRMVHGMRASHDAVMVGGGTARADDPSLTVRGMGSIPQPVRVVLSRHLEIPLTGNLATTAAEIPLWICHGPDAPIELRNVWEQLGATLIECRLSGQQVDPTSVLTALGDKGLTRVFCEGGGAVAASLLKADLVDQLIGFTAGLTLGAEGQASVGSMGVHRLAKAPRFELTQTRAVGKDALTVWRRA
ncbi:MAG: bifunctional diaminohydroxyphosphoribosylaminopyrimidine deaminase/5-amino-6-(5-phosphoribosylamino)uracil reductase RibD [Paracoccaceae bacterium]|nr:bifunctional diaminohydroxyphosphoribosylaminopyrimidine deaminase/5-amino-6-(5-phosphoribosylamino)uracil reductase RibD [Paracoccaceae bacterium]MDG1738756.1 bifunctional diaminohydroxyphosphoribosylaminopyrimidine deaminase/5-amino-6-(5-phosphoribosylamino)uracil reductase RibD [Paracoccaceae bacterium]MDG2258810.1 bifunctional diaminohydroxyphosphoribosylaminopyrimidine deaminase/5-amino-6-(5-phosphoribosylamino)uracil reductase RibD [Paracoccaceae bacterium]